MTTRPGFGRIDPKTHAAPELPDSARDEQPWLALRWLFLFRLLLLIALILLFSPNALDPVVKPEHAELAWRVLVVYAVLVLASGLALYVRRPNRESQIQLAIYIDILAFTLLMMAAGGVASGLGILLGVTVAAGALLMEGRLALLFASFAALAVLTAQLYAELQGHVVSGSYTQAGLLGAVFFAVALLAHVLYRRVREAEAMAARRRVDIANLTKLNAYIIDNLGTGVLVVDGERHLRLINRAALDLLNGDARRPTDALGALAPELVAWLETQVRKPEPDTTLVTVGRRELRASLKLLGDYRASGALIYLRDSQELTREAQQIKLAALGTLTASIAHNIRNPLSAITHASQLFAEDTVLTEDDRHLLEIIRRNSTRIDEIVRSVLQLSRGNQVEPVPLDLAFWLSEFAEELRETHRLSPERCTLEIALYPEPVHVDPRHLQQIVTNLCENALIHGGYEGQPARLHIRLGRSDKASGSLVLEIADQGRGIDAGLVGDIFNPFFTTRSGGTGLGLYIARELAESNGLRLAYLPVQPHGSCFRLAFPG